MQSGPAPRSFGYLAAIVAPAIIGVFMAASWPLFAENPITIYLPAVIVAAWMGGIYPGLVSLTISLLISNFFFIEPYYGFGMPSDANVLRLVVAAVVGVFISIVFEFMLRQRMRFEEGKRSVESSKARFGGIIGSAMDAIIALDSEQKIIIFNNAAELMFKCPPGDAIGQHIDRFIPERFRGAHNEHVRKFGETSVITRSMRSLGGIYGLRSDGEEFPIEASISQLESRGEKFYTVILRDITNRQQAEKALLESEERMRLATATTGVGIWEWNVITGHIAWDAQMFRIYGMPPTPDGVIPYSTWTNCVLPEDLPEQEEALQEAVRRKGKTSRNFRIRLADTGEIRYIQAMEIVRTNAQGEAEWVVGTNLDTTDRQRAEQELRTSHETLEQKVVERTKEFEKATERAEAADSNKTAFLSTVSHELRTPLNSIIGFTGILSMKLSGPLTDEQAEHLAVIQGSSRHLLSLINDLLDIARIDAGRFVLENEIFDCIEVINEVASTLKPSAADKGIKFALDLPEGTVMMETDRRILSQILINLINNAIKFTTAGSVRVGISERITGKHGFICFNVVDTGTGITKEDQKKLFEPFSQIDIDPGIEGSGLGLSLSQKLADQLAGRIEVESESGLGSRFTLVLPHTNLKTK